MSYGFFGVILMGLLGFCTTIGEGYASSSRLKVVATFSVLGDMVRQIGGDYVCVEVIVPEDADPHVYQITPKDAKLLAQAQLVIKNGLGFEGWLDRLIDNSGYKGPLVIASQGIHPRSLVGFNNNNNLTTNPLDPHAWHCVKNGRIYARNIATALKNLLPAHKEAIEKRYRAYDLLLQDLHVWVENTFSSLPAHTRIVVTTHDAFWYYGATYGINFVSPVGISTDAEPSANDIARILRQIKSQNIKAIFLENLSGRKLIEEISHESDVEIGGILYADSLSGPDNIPSPAPTYVEMIRHNTTQIAKALGAPS